MDNEIFLDILNNIKKETFDNLWTVKIYKEILNKKRKYFPKGFWNDKYSKIRAKQLTVYLIEYILKWNDKDIKEKLTNNIFINYNLRGILVLFNWTTYKIINNAYPDKFKPWELKCSQKNYWNKETAKEATKWLIEEKLKWSDEDIKNKLNTKVIYNSKIYGAFLYVFKGCIFNMIDNAYPNKFKKEDFKNYKFYKK